jgi:hypothetical protein
MYQHTMMSSRASLLRGFDPAENDSSIEQKFFFDALKKDLLLDWLEFHFVRDPEFYFSPILSVYYDTPSLSLYNEVRNGDYLKTKVRLRWYQREFSAGQQSVKCFLEIKQKFGARRRKRREPVTVDVQSLTGDLFSQPRILEAPDALPEWHLLVRGILVPLLLVEYERFRFVDPYTGARISLDSGISCARANAAYLAGAVPVRLSSGVLEIKSARDTLPQRLQPMGRYLRKQSFSKYASCCQFLIEPKSSWRPV